MEYQVSLTPQAAAQIQRIGQYIATSLGQPDTADRWMDHLQKEIAGLAFMPLRFPLTEEEPWRSRGIRRMTVKNFLVYYLTDEGSQRVSVTAVIYGRRDQLRALCELPED